jgi:hypothetical protein
VSRPYPSDIPGVKFLRERQLPMSVVVSEFQTTKDFSPDSAHRLLMELPEDHQMCYADPDRQLVGGSSLMFLFADLVPASLTGCHTRPRFGLERGAISACPHFVRRESVGCEST